MSWVFNFLRWIIFIFLSLINFVLVLIFIVFLSIYFSLFNSSNAKNFVESSGVYKELPNVVNTFIEKQTGDQPGLVEITDQIKDKDTVIGKFVNDKLNSNFASESVGKIIDSVYSWLEKKQDSIDFKITLFDSQKQFEDILAFGLAEKVKSLPKCPVNLKKAENPNPFELECYPPNYSLSNVQSFINDMRDREEFKILLEHTVIDSKTFIQINEEDSNKVRGYYAIFIVTPLIVFVVLSILFALFFAIAPAKDKLLFAILPFFIPLLLIFSTFMFILLVPNVTNHYAYDLIHYSSHLDNYSDSILEIGRSLIRYFSIVIGIISFTIICFLGLVYLISKKISKIK